MGRERESDSPSCASLKLILCSGLPAVFSQHSVLSPGNPLHHTQQRRQHLCSQRCRRWYLANLPGQLNVRQCVSQIQDGAQYLSSAAVQRKRERERRQTGGAGARLSSKMAANFPFASNVWIFILFFCLLPLPLLLYLLTVNATRIFCIGNLASFSDSCRYVFFYFSCTLLHLLRKGVGGVSWPSLCVLCALSRYWATKLRYKQQQQQQQRKLAIQTEISLQLKPGPVRNTFTQDTAHSTEHTHTHTCTQM